jgi:enoyl-[acyl-carrier protein] reductase I
MGFLADKKILITGLLSKHSIAYGIAKACHREGAQLAFTYQTERFEDRIKKFAAEFGSDITIPLDVSSDEQIDNVFVELAKRWDGLDGLVHSIAYAPTEAIEGDFLNGISREAFRIAHDISSYSYAALAKGARPMMQGRKASLLALSYLGAERTMPNYNTMGLAKASLEAATRYLAFSLGSYNAHHAPLRRNVTIDEVGNAAAFLLSDLASGITGEIMYVDGGMNTTALGNAEPLPA